MKNYLYLLATIFLCSCGGGSTSGGIGTDNPDGVYYGVWKVIASAESVTGDSETRSAAGIKFSDTDENTRDIPIEISINGSDISISTYSNGSQMFEAKGKIDLKTGKFGAVTTSFTGIIGSTLSVTNTNGKTSNFIGSSGQYTFDGRLQNNTISGTSISKFRTSTINNLDSNILDIAIFIDFNGDFTASKNNPEIDKNTSFDIAIQL